MYPKSIKFEQPIVADHFRIFQIVPFVSEVGLLFSTSKFKLLLCQQLKYVLKYEHLSNLTKKNSKYERYILNFRKRKFQ